MSLKRAMIDLEHESMMKSDISKALNKASPLLDQVETILTDVCDWPNGNIILQQFLNWKCEAMESAK